MSDCRAYLGLTLYVQRSRAVGLFVENPMHVQELR